MRGVRSRWPWLAAGLALSLLAVSASAAEDKIACANAAEHAQSLRAARSLKAAREELLRCSREGCPKGIRRDCEGWLREVETDLPSLVFRANDGHGTDLIEVELTLDGTRLASRLDGAAVVVDPGPHVVRFSANGLVSDEQTVLVTEGEKNRAVVGVLRAATATAPSATTSVPPSTPPSAPPLASSSSTGVAPWVFGVGGVAAIATFGVLQLVARSRRAALDDGCGRTSSCTHDQVAPVRTEFLVSGVALGVGVVALGVAGGLVWFRGSSGATVAGAVRPLQGGAVLGVDARF